MAHRRRGIAGPDANTGGGLPVRRTCLVSGAPGTGKTTLCDQPAFVRAESGGHQVAVTLLTGSYNVLLKNRDRVLLDLMMWNGDGGEVPPTMQAQSQLDGIPVATVSIGFGLHQRDGASVPCLT